jgi:hypothetical protein
MECRGFVEAGGKFAQVRKVLGLRVMVEVLMGEGVELVWRGGRAEMRTGFCGCGLYARLLRANGGVLGLVCQVRGKNVGFLGLFAKFGGQSRRATVWNHE